MSENKTSAKTKGHHGDGGFHCVFRKALESLFLKKVSCRKLTGKRKGTHGFRKGREMVRELSGVLRGRSNCKVRHLKWKWERSSRFSLYARRENSNWKMRLTFRNERSKVKILWHLN